MSLAIQPEQGAFPPPPSNYEVEALPFEPSNPKYTPHQGLFIPEGTPKNLENCTLRIGSYITELASRRVGIYTSFDYDVNSASQLPPIAVDTALGTSVKGHSQSIAEDLIKINKHLGVPAAVVVKGPPRYHRPTLSALTLTQEANETHGLLDELSLQGVLHSTETVGVYGESQGAMKALGTVALAPSYGREVVDGLVVAPCYLRPANWKNPLIMAQVGVSMVAGMLRTAPMMDLEKIKAQKGTFSVKDVHNHVIVIPILMSGEAGTFLDYIAPNQKLTWTLFGKDGSSRPHGTRREVERRFSNMVVHLYEQYGHCDGIMSPETEEHREQVFTGWVEKLAA